MNIAVIGIGYVGITTVASMVELGHKVIGVDIDASKIEQCNKGAIPIYEPDVEPLIQKYLIEGSLSFTTNMKEAAENNDIIFISVGTPSLPDGRPNVRYVEEVATEIGKYMMEYSVIVNKSTVPIGTADHVGSIITEQLKLRSMNISFDVVSNPEFLREGRALRDARKPDRIILGCSSSIALDMMLKLYEKVDAPKLITSPRSAEMIKYASNGFLATKISFINEIGRLCNELNLDVVEVAKGMGLDHRIGPKFLHAGIGYGGSCFPKDVSALVIMGRDVNVQMSIVESVQKVNQTQTDWFLERIKKRMNGLKGKRIALLGLTFKPDTDDIREAPSLRLIRSLIYEGVVICGFDPVANDKIKNIYPNVLLAEDAYQATTKADAVIICTEWQEIISLDWHVIKLSMKGDFIFDGRNILDRAMLESEGFQYMGV